MPSENSRRRLDIEETEQIFLISWFEAAWPSFFPFLIHCPNGGKRPIGVARRLKRMGVKPGVSDLFLALPKGGYAGLWLEYKPAPPAASRLTTEQRRWLHWMRGNGYRAEWVRGPIAFADVMSDYLQCPPQRSLRAHFLRLAACRVKPFPHWLGALLID